MPYMQKTGNYWILTFTQVAATCVCVDFTDSILPNFGQWQFFWNTPEQLLTESINAGVSNRKSIFLRIILFWLEAFFSTQSLCH